MSMTTDGIFQFGEFQLDVRARSLRRDAAIVALNSRAFDVLLYLVRNPGKVLTRDELLKNVWPDAFVDENNLAQSISALRRALDAKPGDNSYIVTLPGRGYQFVATVSVVTPDVARPESGSTPPEIAATGDSQSTGFVFQKHTVETSVITQEKQRPGSRRFLSVGALLAIAAICVVTVAVAVSGMWYWRSHRPPKLTEKDTIVVADFENRTGDPVFDDTLKQALAVDLEQSPYLNVVSDQKIGEGLKLMGRDTGQRVTGEVARDLCQRVSSNAVLQGSIASLGKQYVLVLTVTNCATGDSLASEQVRAESKEKILPAIDKAASGLRRRLGESLGSIEKYETPVEQATTPSLAALQAYSAGVSAWRSGGNQAAIPFYKRAIELDPNFAMAYARLGQCYYNLRLQDLGIENLNKAFHLRDRVSEREKFYIDSRYYNIVTGEDDMDVQVLEQWRRVYPREWNPAISLVVEYKILGRYDEALREANASVSLDPGVELNYSNLVFAALALNRLDEAQAALKEWQARSSVSESQVYVLYMLAFLRNDPAGMQKQLSRGADFEDGFFRVQADREAYYGRFRRSRQFTRRAMALRNGLKESGSAPAAASQLVAGLWEALVGNSKQAQSDVIAALHLSKSEGNQFCAAFTLALAGDSRGADAIASALAKRNPLDTTANMYWLPSTRAAIQLNRNNPARAVQELEGTSRFELGSANFSNDRAPLFPVYIRGQAFLALHQGREAAAEFQKYLDHPGMVLDLPFGALARVGLARAYAMEGDTAKARSAYEDFFNLWKDADPDVPILMQARAEYQKLLGTNLKASR